MDDYGQVDVDKVSVQVAAVLDGRPGLAVQVKWPKPNRSQGHQSTLVDSG
jgi:hypothetical protein